MIEKVYKYIRDTPKFRLAVWSNQTEKNKIGILFNLICSSLNYDYNNLGRRSFKLNDIVYFMDSDKTYYAKFEGFFIEGNHKCVKLIANPNSPLHYKIKSSQLLWKLNRSNDQNRKISKSLPLTNYGDIDDVTEILAELVQVPTTDFYQFNRTQILYLTNSSSSNIESEFRKWEYNSHCFLDYFPAFYYYNAKERRKLNTSKYNRNDPERILHIFNNMQDLIEFVKINKNKHKDFFITGDSYSRFFNKSLLRDFYEITFDEAVNLKVLYTGGTSDFRKINSNDENAFLSNDLLKPILLDGQNEGISKITSQIILAGTEELNKIIDEIRQQIKKYKDLNPDYSRRIRQLLFALLSYNEFEDNIHKSNFDAFQNDYTNDRAAKLLYELSNLVLENKFKQRHVNNSKRIVVNKYLPHNESCIVSKNDFLKAYKEPSIISFIDIYFLRDSLFPLLITNEIDHSQIEYLYYPFEKKIFLSALRKFMYKYKPYIKNATLIGIENNFELDIESEVIAEVIPESIEDFYEYIRKEYEMPFHQARIGQSMVKAYPLKLYDDNSEYLAFFTPNSKVTVIKAEQIYDKKAEEIEIGDELVILEGVRNIFQKFSEVFDRVQINLDIKDKWREALQNFYDNYGFSLLAKKLKDVGLIRADATILNWLNNPNSIGTISPFEDFEKIAKATEDAYLLQNHHKVAEVCHTLQGLSHKVGRWIRRLARAKLEGQDLDLLLIEYQGNIREELNQIIRDIKIVQVNSIGETLIEIESTQINHLLEYDQH